MTQYSSPLLRFLLFQILLLTLCSSFPYTLSSDYELSNTIYRPTDRFNKQAFDRVENNGFENFKREPEKRAFDRLDMADFGFRRKRAFDRIARAEFGLEGFRKKRAFDRVSMADFGLRRKRAFDRLSSTEFGLIKRSYDHSYPSRDALIDELARSIVAMDRSTPVALLMAPSAEEQK